MDQINTEIYEAAREAMNFQAGEVAHHLLEAGRYSIDAFEHWREARRMEKENEEEE